MKTIATLFAAFTIVAAPAFAATPKPTSAAPTLVQTVIKMPVTVPLDDAVESMKLRANGLNMKLVAELPLSKQVEAMTGKPTRRMTIYQFCDAMTAKQMVDFSIDFAAYLPCRIALIEDEKGKGWLVMTNLDILIQSAKLNPTLSKKATEVRDNLLSIMRAGANGDL